MIFLVAGGAGFVGSHLCRRLIGDGHEVVCVDSLITGDPANVADLASESNFRFVLADIAEVETIRADVIFHLASPASPVDYDRYPLETLRANSVGTWRLLEMARATGARLVYTSTSEVYGDPLVHPQPETYWGNVDPVGPRACYDEAKRFGEALITSMRRVHGVSATIVRLFNTYGPSMRRDDGRAIPELMSAALAGRPLPVHDGGRQSRSFMYVTDLIDALLLVGLDPAADGQIYNIGNPEEVTILELAEAIAGLVAPSAEIRSVPGRPGDPQRRRPDITRMSAAYGWRPRVPLSAGLATTAAWFASPSTRPAEPSDAVPVVAGGASF